MEEKVIAGFTKYLTKREYLVKDILEKDSDTPTIVYQDNDQLVFADCRLGIENNPRPKLEVVLVALKWLRQNEPGETLVRFDNLAINIVDKKYGLIEHHIKIPS